MDRIAALLCLGVVACAAPQTPFTPRRFESTRDPYAVYLDAQHQLLGRDWRIANYQIDHSRFSFKGEQAIFTKQAKLVPRQGRGYDVKRTYDVDGDGIADVRSVQRRNDLAFEHRGHNGRIWLRSVAVSPRNSGADLRDLAERLGNDGYNGRTIAARPCQLSGREAVIVDRDSVVRHSRLVLVRTGFVRQLHEARLPVFMIAGFSANPDDFAALQRDFADFVGRIALGSRETGIPLPGGNSCGLSQPFATAKP
jgi:hypothetical protein